jgi:hypothetical protein
MDKDLEIISAPPTAVKQFDPEKDVVNAQMAAKALMTVIDATKPLTMNGKRYLYFEHWQTIARFFRATVGIEWTKPIMAKDTIIGWEAKAVVYQDGITIGGAEAACMADERNWVGKPSFQVRSMAQTRAMSKALRSIFGFVAVLAGVEATPAEEIIETEPFAGNEFSGKENKTVKESTLVKRLASKAQVNLINKLSTEKNCPVVFDEKTLTSQDASEMIKSLIAQEGK